VRGAPSPPSHPLCINQTWHPSRGSPLSLGCAFRFVFRFLLGLIFQNSGNSTEFPEFRGTHVRIKSFQGKINLLRNSGSGIPEGRTRDLCHNTIWYRTTILLQFATPFNVACGAWSAITVVSTDSCRTPPATSPASRC
jgi:hypothetical protein